MTHTNFYSAKLRFAVFDASPQSRFVNDCLYLFKAADFQSAFERVLALGKQNEKSYPNAQGEMVTWKLAEILTLDIILGNSLDGVEIYSETSDAMVYFMENLKPQLSKPVQTI